MTARVVTIARTLGAGGEAIGHKAADELGYEYIDHGVIDRAAHISGADTATVERAERPKSLVGRLLGSLADHLDAGNDGPTLNLPGEVIYIAQAATTGGGTPTVPYTSYESLIREVIDQIADDGSAVIVAHGAGVRLAERDDVLRVLITASTATRIERVGTSEELSASEAEAAVRESDRARAHYLRQFYDVRDELPTLYDVVVNTDKLSEPDAVAIIATAAR